MGDGKIDVLLFGLGAIGGFYAYILGKNENVYLSVVARSNHDSITANGLSIESSNHGNQKVQIDHVYRQPSDAGIKFDYIVCCNKAINVESMLPILKDVAGEQTTFVLIQNGVGIEDPYRKAYPRASIISCVTWVSAIQNKPGIITHLHGENLQIGLFKNANLDPSLEQSRLDTFADFMRNGGTNHSIEDDVQIRRWEKVSWNASLNPLMTLTMVDTQMWFKSSTEAVIMTKRLMQEMVSIAKHCGVRLPDDFVDTGMDKILATPGAYGSMYADMKEGRPLEVEVMLGTPLKKAREFGLDVPFLSTIYALIVAVDQRIRQSKH